MPDDVVVEGNDDLEVVFVQDGEPLEEPVQQEPQGKVLSDAEYQALVEKAEAARALATPLEQAIGKMGQAQAVPPPVNVQQPGETNEEFYKRMEEKAFQPGQFGTVMEEVNRRAMAPIIGQFSTIILDQAKKLMRVDPESGANFRKYEEEIEREVQQVPIQQRGINVYQDAYQKVMVRHQGDLINEAVASRMDELEKQILEKYGLKKEELVEGGAARGTPVQSLGQRGVAQKPASKGPLKLYESEKGRMLALGMNPEDPMAVQAYLDNNPRRK